MHITQEADYAVRIVYELSRNEKRLGAATISERADVPLRFALKILGKLTAKKILKSYKGVKGGYELCRPAKEISLKQVIEAVEGTYFISRCLNSDYKCRQENCKFYKVYDEISETVREKLDSINFDFK